MCKCAWELRECSLVGLARKQAAVSKKPPSSSSLSLFWLLLFWNAKRVGFSVWLFRRLAGEYRIATLWKIRIIGSKAYNKYGLKGVDVCLYSGNSAYLNWRRESTKNKAFMNSKCADCQRLLLVLLLLRYTSSVEKGERGGDRLGFLVSSTRIVCICNRLWWYLA